MSAPDAREWYHLEPGQVEGIARSADQFAEAHPETRFHRCTVLGVERGDPWICIDGWVKRPDDQGPEPTDADIPAGFV